MHQGLCGWLSRRREATVCSQDSWGAKTTPAVQVMMLEKRQVTTAAMTLPRISRSDPSAIGSRLTPSSHNQCDMDPRFSAVVLTGVVGVTRRVVRREPL